MLSRTNFEQAGILRSIPFVSAAARWDFRQICAQQAQRLSLRLDLREPGVMQRIDGLLAQHRPGPTPLRLDLLLPQGTAGTVDLNGPQSVRVEADLPSSLRALPGVRTVKVAIGKPWAS